MAKQCRHLDQIRSITPRANGCEEYLKMGDTWVHLRICSSVAISEARDDSKNTHATRHFHATTHPLMQSFQPGKNWRWCYIDQLFLEFADRVWVPRTL